MHIIRFNKEALHINICNLHPSIELTSPVYCSNSTCHVPPSQQTYVGTASTSFGIDHNQKVIEGVLLYKLRRKYTTRTDNYLNNVTAPIKDTNTYLLAIWNIKDDYHSFSACLIEFTDDLTLNEDKLWALYQEHCYVFYWFPPDLSSSWLLYGDSAMKITCYMTYRSDYKLDIIISEGTREYFIMEPKKINPKRLVLLLSMLIVLIYVISLSVRPSFKLNIYNQCLNVSLVSPVYVTSNNLECHRPPDHQVYARDTVKSSFIIESGNESYGILIYKLQIMQIHEFTKIGKDASSTAQLLIIWRISESNELYADVLLVEHDKGFDLDKDDLEELYRKNFDRFRLCPDSATETWLLDDNTSLKTTFKTMNEDYILNMIFSEVERDSNTRIPAHIDSER
jgi:hypothetical protein